MRRYQEAGVTMVELTIVLAIIAILAAAVYPQLSNLRQIMGAKGASEEVAGSLRLARQYAVTRGYVHCVQFNGNPTTFTIMWAPDNNPLNCNTVVAGQSPTPIGHNLAVLTYNPPLASQTLIFDPIGRATNIGAGPQDLDVGQTAGQCPRKTVELSRFGGVRVFTSTGC